MAYEKGKPEPGIKAKFLDDRVRGNNDFIQPAINNEHNFVDADANNQSGDHTQGSARCFFAATAPAVRIDTTSFIETDNGSLWVNTSDNALSIMTDYSQALAADKWTLISDDVIAVLLAANRVFAGDLGVNGNFTMLTDQTAIIETIQAVDISGVVIKDKDGVRQIEFKDGGGVDSSESACISTSITLSEDDDDLLASQKAIKTYINNQITASFNPFTNLGSGSLIEISGGGITITSSNHRIDTQNQDPTDSLNNINGGTAGDLLVIRSVDNGRTVNVTETGNIELLGASFALDNNDKTLTLLFRGTTWVETSRSNN
jgi:hypothetical protein